MATDHADDLVPFQDVRVIRSTAPARGQERLASTRAHQRQTLVHR